MPLDTVTFDMPADPGRSSAATHLTGALVPDEVFGKYKVLRMLGEGAFGRVYLALDPLLDMEVAIKVPKSKELTDEFLKRFRGEGMAAARIRHPNVCRVLAADSTEDGRPYFVFDFVPGDTLAARLAGGRRLPPREAARLMSLVARGVDAAHKARVIHRDLKPANILIQPDPDGDRPVVTDFGVARVGGREFGSTDGQTIGTLAYMPPEQGLGQQHRVGAWSDVYAMGVILFELLTGQDPYPDRLGFVEVQVRGRPPHASDRLP